MRNAKIYFVFAAFIIYYLSFPIRTFRWRMLLENVGYTEANGIHLPKFWKLLEIVYVSWFANVIVPAKLGDLYWAYLLRREAGLPASRTFGTVIAERLLDLIVLLLLFIPSVIISLHENLPPQLVLGLKITMMLVVVGIIGLFMLRMFPTADRHGSTKTLSRILRSVSGRHAWIVSAYPDLNRAYSWCVGL